MVRGWLARISRGLPDGSARVGLLVQLARNVLLEVRQTVRAVGNGHRVSLGVARTRIAWETMELLNQGQMMGGQAESAVSVAAAGDGPAWPREQYPMFGKTTKSDGWYVYVLHRLALMLSVLEVPAETVRDGHCPMTRGCMSTHGWWW